jgi:hypothetical protein
MRLPVTAVRGAAGQPDKGRHDDVSVEHDASDDPNHKILLYIKISERCDGYHRKWGSIRYVAPMTGECTTFAQMCPSCGKPMGLSRTVPASAGLCELQTYGCKDCRVWVTEAKDRWVSEIKEPAN